MKYSTTFLVFSSFLVFALALTKPSIAADLDVDENEEVRDTDGNIVRAGVEYYILPVFRGRGGGVSVVSIGDQLCELTVVQETIEESTGFPVTFTPVNPKKGVIRLSTDLNIKFILSPFCDHDQSAVWRILKSSNSKIQWFISTAGVEGNPGCNTVTNWFKIEKYGKGYKLVFCPTVCGTGVLCRDIGVYIDSNGNRILSLSDKLEPFLVKFHKLSPLSSSI